MAGLFEPVKLGAIALSNSIVMAPMTRDRAGAGDVPTDVMVDYYRQRATAGLIITEGTQPSAAGKGYWRTPGIHTPQQTQGWAKVAEAVHAEGGKIVMQLMHVGRAAVAANKDMDADTIAPSAIQCPDKIPGPDGVPQDCVVPTALETNEIAGVVADYVHAARCAIEAGMDGVEFHCASGYLPMQFLSSNSNQRTDQYGGSAENRVRFVVETLAALSEAIGADRVGFRICPGVTLNGMADANPAQTYETLLKAVDGTGLAYLHLIDLPQEGLDALALVKANWTGPLILNNSRGVEDNIQRLENATADAVSFGRGFIANPDLVGALKRGEPLARPDRATIYTGQGDDARGYTDYV
ncbi:alkene reductase [Brevundimonas terrae]|uniref:Alkene reductase n=1 Tax=Brevundimonas terrae TaxID=363631 RepID=A0ABP3I1W5_9CAUL|nr:alkene reductase [Brevundimonas terrae]NIJ25382.1 N-ethylmaleimide reductase [Brevundimonas terrae]